MLYVCMMSREKVQCVCGYVGVYSRFLLQCEQCIGVK